jgi:hypothetical protein
LLHDTISSTGYAVPNYGLGRRDRSLFEDTIPATAWGEWENHENTKYNRHNVAIIKKVIKGRNKKGRKKGLKRTKEQKKINPKATNCMVQGHLYDLTEHKTPCYAICSFNIMVT